MKWLNLRCYSIILCLAIAVRCIGQSPSFRNYTNPVIPGDHPDPTLTRVGSDFYTTGSSFNPTPVIYHSTDLVHWEIIAQPVKASWSNYGDKPGGGCWGGHLVYYNNKFWHFFSRGDMYYVWANDPKGTWSEPVSINNPSNLPYKLGYDNSIFIDDDGKWYLVVKNGQPNNAIVELGNDGQPTGTLYNLSWLNPAPSYPYSWAEGPVMWKYMGYYYYSFAKNVAGGQLLMRSKEITADSASWEMLGNFYNENDLLKKSAIFKTPNHCSPPVMLDDSTSWVITQSYAQNQWKGQARQGILSQVRYTGLRPVADYPVNTTFTAPKLPGSGIPWMVPKSDFFNNNKLNPEWSFLGFTEDSAVSLTERPGWLRLSPKANKVNTVIKIEGEHNYSLITRVLFNPQTPDAEAGLRIMRSDEKQFLKLYSSVNGKGENIICFAMDSLNKYNDTRNNPGDILYETENSIGDILWLKIQRDNHVLSGYYSNNGKYWIQVGSSINASSIDELSANWIGTRIGLYVQKQRSFFDLFIYRDAYSPILAECQANQYGTSQVSNLLDNIHNNDWALYAGIEFGDIDYPRASDSVQFNASCETNGGTVEIWLDSIDTGNKIGECTINSTGSWATFKKFSAPVKKITGRHDVYLKFTGTGTDKLFQLKSFIFISKGSNPDEVQANASRQIETLTSPGNKVSLATHPKVVTTYCYEFIIPT